MIPSLSASEWQSFEGESDPKAILLTTPFCGTCKLARQMLDVVKNGKPQWPLYELSVMEIPEDVQRWQIRSVPCIIIVQGHDLIDHWYRIGSVPELWATLDQHFSKLTGEKIRHEKSDDHT